MVSNSDPTLGTSHHCCPLPSARPVDHGYGVLYRPPGCVGHATPDPNATPGDPTSAVTCRIRDSTYPEPQSPFTPHQIHIQPAGVAGVDFSRLLLTSHPCQNKTRGMFQTIFTACRHAVHLMLSPAVTLHCLGWHAK